MAKNLGTIDASAYFIVLGYTVPKRKRGKPRAYRRLADHSAITHVFPEQTAYELLRPIVLYGDPAVQRAKETGEARNTLERKADAFDEQGMVSVFASKPRTHTEARSLPPDMRQLMVDLHVELPSMSLREIADICEVRFNRKPSHHTVQLVLATGPPPSLQTKCSQSWEKIADPAERRLVSVFDCRVSSDLASDRLHHLETLSLIESDGITVIVPRMCSGECWRARSKLQP